jgi:hydrogenase nickel incorporation protein HypA/HybF
VHEVALTESILDAIRQRLGDARVVRVRLAIGQLTAVLPEALRFAFAACTAGTSFDGARLEIDEVAAHGQCRACARQLELDGVVALCPCGSADLELRSGQELQIKEVEVA